jgi:hypothetical protein
VRQYLAGGLDRRDLDAVASMSRDELLGLYCPGLGMWVRNAYGLWQGNDALLASCLDFSRTHELLFRSWGDPEDASMTIIEALWLRLTNDSRR